MHIRNLSAIRALLCYLSFCERAWSLSLLSCNGVSQVRKWRIDAPDRLLLSDYSNRLRFLQAVGFARGWAQHRDQSTPGGLSALRLLVGNAVARAAREAVDSW